MTKSGLVAHIIGRKAARAALRRGTALAALGWIATGAAADPLDVTTALTNPVTTGMASNGTPGDVTIESAGSIIVTTTGPALTVNSNNNVTNGGAVSSSATTGATALLVDGSGGGLATTISNTGTISVSGTGGSGNYGLRVANGPISGSITGSTTSAITVQGTNALGFSLESAFTGPITLHAVTTPGDNSTAISLTAPLTGTLTLGGASSATSTGGIALLIASPITGAVDNVGTLTSGTASSTSTASSGTTTSVPAVGGPATVSIQSSISGGFVNDRTYADSTGASVPAASATSADTATSAAISGYDGTPAILVQPGGAAPSAISIGAYGVAGSADGYGLINRGDIATAGNSQGVNATAVLITGAASGGTVYGATIAGGLTNQANGSIGATASDAAARAIEIGNGAIVPQINNAGALSAIVTNVTTGGNAYGIQLDAGSQVGAIVNSGTIVATAGGGTYSAYGILDSAGSVTSVVNSGTISAAGGGNGVSRAIDLSAGTGPQTIVNSGTINGDILFGGGVTSYTSDSGTLNGTLAFGSGAGSLILAGTTSFANPVTVASGGALAVSLADSSRLAISGAAPTLSSLSASGSSSLVIDVSGANAGVAVTGAASFTQASTIQLALSKPVGAAPITILTAGGGITTDHADTLVGVASIPFLYTVQSFSVGSNTVTATIHQKSASEIGFAPGVAPLFDQSIAALGAGGAEFAGLVALPNEASVLAAYRQIEPPTYGSANLRVAESLETAGFGAIEARLDAIAAAPAGGGGRASHFGVWAQQGGDFLRYADHQDDPGFTANTLVLAFGGDYALTRNLTAGLGMHFGWSNVGVDGASVSGKPLHASHTVGDAYLGWHAGPFYVQAIGSVGTDHYEFNRRMAFGGYAAAQSAGWSGMQYGGSLTAGLRLVRGGFILQPSDSFSYLSLKQDGYQEAGAGAFDLAVAAQRQHLANNVARLTAGYGLPLGVGKLEILAHGAYLTRLDRDPLLTDASFLSGGQSFELSSQPLPRSETEEGGSIGYRDNDLSIALSGSRRQGSGARDTSFAVVVRGVF